MFLGKRYDRSNGVVQLDPQGKSRRIPAGGIGGIILAQHTDRPVPRTEHQVAAEERGSRDGEPGLQRDLHLARRRARVVTELHKHCPRATQHGDQYLCARRPSDTVIDLICSRCDVSGETEDIGDLAVDPGHWPERRASLCVAMSIVVVIVVQLA